LRNPYEYAFFHPVLEKALNNLTLLQFFRENHIAIGNEYKAITDLSNEEIAHAAFLASFLASSSLDRHKQKAIAFAILLYLEKREIQEYASFSYIIFSRTGIIQQGKHIENLFDESGNHFLVKFDEILNAELSARRFESCLQLLQSNPIYMSDFQKKIWAELQTNKRLIGISGPTSSGKSHIIQSYILSLSRRKKSFRILYIVPTRALISEVSSKLRKALSAENVFVRIAAGEKEEKKEREILVLTPERCLRLLRYKATELSIDLIFCDEFQKIEDPERGVLLEYVLYELLRIYKNVRVAIAGPYLKNLKTTIDNLTYQRSTAIESELTPVYQLKSILRVPNRKNDKISVVLKNDYSRTEPTTFLIDKPLSYKAKRQSDKVASIIKTYAVNSNNIVFSPTRKKAEDIALALAETSDERKDSELNDLIALLGKEIHPDFSLIRCLRHGVAFHHSMIPEMAKLEIEELYRKEIIRNIACTTTLLEGVNLPADRVFIYRPWKRNRRYPLSSFDFGNLVGRAGRADTRLNGSVYCLEIGDDEWAKEKLESDPRKELIPTTSHVITQENTCSLEENLGKKSTEMFYNDTQPSTVFTILLLRQKALKDRDRAGENELSNYLRKKQLTKKQMNRIEWAVGQSINNLEIPYKITRLNPTIDPVLQNALYNDMKNNLYEWVIDKKVKESGDKGGEFKDRGFYYQFEDVLRRLDNIFDIEGTIRRKQKYRKWYRTPNIYTLTYYGVTWMEQKQLNWIIMSELKEEGKDNRVVDELKQTTERYRNDPTRFELERLKIIDKLIREVVEHIHSNVRHHLVKYFKLWSDVLEDLLPEEEKQLYAQSLAIPEMLELGASKPNVITLIRAGVTRSVAIQAGNKLERMNPNFQGDVIAWLMEHKQLLDPIYVKHLERVGFTNT
jgi:hypothetical protein